MIELIFWAVLFVVMVLLELLTLGLTTIWFAAGAVAAIIAQFFGAPFVIQAIIFLVVSVALLYLLAPLTMSMAAKRLIIHIPLLIRIQETRLWNV